MFFIGFFIGLSLNAIVSFIKQSNETESRITTLEAANLEYGELLEHDLFSISSGEGLNLNEKSEVLLLYWGTWCPYCKNLIQSLSGYDLKSIIGIPIEFDRDYFNYYNDKNQIPFDNIGVSVNGTISFINEKPNFSRPLLPSLFVVQQNQVVQIITGFDNIIDFFKII